MLRRPYANTALRRPYANTALSDGARRAAHALERAGRCDARRALLVIEQRPLAKVGVLAEPRELALVDACARPRGAHRWDGGGTAGAATAVSEMGGEREGGVRQGGVSRVARESMAGRVA
eukprot:238970-Prymnesium_polylepis.1